MEFRLIKSAFTLIELIIVVAILGILAAIVLPEVQGFTQKAKESTAKDNLRILRESIERYAADHNGTPPGYPFGNTGLSPNVVDMQMQLLFYTNKKGEYVTTKDASYPYGPYLSEIPDNPLDTTVGTVKVLLDTEEFPTEASANTDWIYKPLEKKIYPNTIGNDSIGQPYYKY